MSTEAAPTEAMSNLNITSKGTAKRDALRANEVAVQQKWEEAKAYESDPDATKESFLVTFPYPYMNGVLHIGHGFSLTKAVFRAQFERHRGKNVLFPFGFHCTGMPIQAAANKLKAEIANYGMPPAFPEDDPAVRAEMERKAAEEAAAKAKAAKSNDKKAKGGKTKLVAKTGTGIVRQWNILKKMVPEEIIGEFVDPNKWLSYFPPIGVDHLKKFGAGVDWRRSFITTAVNPYYDAFIRWQFNTLRKKGKVLFGKRNNIYSLLDGQVCADHDRSEGEGVGPQEYVIIKLRVLEFPGKLAALEGRDVFLAPATLRPETMYGQTNCFVLPEGKYGAYEMENGEVFIISERAARNMSCQGYTSEFGKVTCLVELTGTELLGLPLSAPNATYERVYTLPLLTISMGKGTGVVTSVPSDAPDDYVSLKALQDKPEFREKYGITAEMVEPFKVVPIIEVPGYGDASAVFMCEKLKIKSFNDKAKLAQAKDETYLKGFNFGVMTYGPHKGKKVCDAKPIIKQEMIDANQACLYFEPESKVMSRTGDECVVAATDQWYLAYGEDSWAKAVKEHIFSESFTAYDETALGKYDYTVGWLKEWACTRQFGLGTQLPWDEQWVIESLSDSTIYMAYYTIAHHLQGEDNLNGSKGSPAAIDAADLTDEVFDFVFNNADMPADSKVAATVLEKMQKEFRYWYPMNLRVSAKDLIPNHLTMALYNHAAIWDDEPGMWPRGYYTNGHVLVDAEKMSKSKGNFLMLNETVEKYSCDATRFACADAGDTIDDANFSRETADSAIVSLSNEEAWIKEVLDSKDSLRTGDDLNFMDKVILNETRRLVKLTEDSFESMQFREGLQKGWFEMLNARNQYRSWCSISDVPMHKDLIMTWIESVIVLICPVCPHWSEMQWAAIGKNGLAVTAAWPVVGEEDKLLTRQALFLRKALPHFRSLQGKAKKGCNKGSVLVKDSYPQWKVDTLTWMRSQYDSSKSEFPASFMGDLKKWAMSLPDKKMMKNIMQFASFMRNEANDVGLQALELSLPFDQKSILVDSEQYLKSQLELEEISIFNLDTDENIPEIPGRILDNVTPGKPYLYMHA
uniref:leucine--tRNA ligase n=1 Tax=Leptocylindrus danicus TaxID=163516 RepID=A0A6U2REQ0_9STRA|mmetsp:Transcript_34376/g.49931  ORF Transcript_34376/g.49931 Transcript_34376/m.49931 type:complete len:1082 (+) Transcript_34376:118-3363(+)